jgi:hypothetical protein
MALLWPLFARSAWDHPATVVAGTMCEGAVLASVLLVYVVSYSHIGGWHDRSGRFCGLCSLGRRGLRKPLWWRALNLRVQLWPLFACRRGPREPLWWLSCQVRVLMWTLFAWLSWAQPSTVVAGKTGEGAAMTSVSFVVVVSNSHCGGGHDR